MEPADDGVDTPRLSSPGLSGFYSPGHQSSAAGGGAGESKAPERYDSTGGVHVHVSRVCLHEPMPVYF